MIIGLMKKLKKHGIGGKLLKTVGNWLTTVQDDSEFVLKV